MLKLRSINPQKNKKGISSIVLYKYNTRNIVFLRQGSKLEGWGGGVINLRCFYKFSFFQFSDFKSNIHSLIAGKRFLKRSRIFSFFRSFNKMLTFYVYNLEFQVHKSITTLQGEDIVFLATDINLPGQ